MARSFILALGAASLVGCILPLGERIDGDTEGTGAGATTAGVGAGSTTGTGGFGTGGFGTGGFGTGGFGTGGFGMGGSGDGGFGDGGFAPCQGGACIPLAPAGWDGPGYLVLSATDPVCPFGVASPLYGLTNTWSAPPAMCSCSCSADPAGCSMTVRQYYGGAGTCVDPLQSTTSVSTQCLDVADNMPNATYSSDAPAAIACQPMQSAPNVPSASFGTLARLCDPNLVPGGCEAGSFCYQDPPAGAKRCVWNATGQPCVGGSNFPYSFVIGTPASVDSRGCDSCSCSGAATCTGSVEHHGDNACGGVDNSVGFGGCFNTSGVFGSLRYQAQIGGSTCSPVGGGPIGGYPTVDVFTVCCETP